MPTVSTTKHNLHEISEEGSLRKGDIITLLFCAVLSGMIAYLVASDRYFFSKAYTPKARQTVADIQTSEAGVKHRTADIPLWKKKSGSYSLANLDQVFTDKESRAEIRFHSTDTILQVDPNSLVVIKEETERADGDWFRNFVGSTPVQKKTVIEVNGKSATLAPGSRVQISNKQDGSSSIKVMSGEVMIASATEEIAIYENEVANVSNSEELVATVEKLQITIESPSYGNIFEDTAASTRIPLRWSSSQVAPNGYTVEVSTGPSFSPGTTRQYTLAKTETTIPVRSSGKYYWRVFETGNPDSSVTSHFSYRAIRPLDLLSPINNFSKTASRTSQTRIHLRWEKSLSSKYTLQVAKDGSFQVLETNTVLSTNHYLFTPSETGRFYWRVGQDTKSGIQWSPRRSLVIIPAPELRPPSRLDSSLESSGIATLNWLGDSAAVGYNIQVAQDRDFTQPRTLYTANTNTSFTIEEAGSYYWRVRSIGTNNDASAFSDPSSFELIVPNSPEPTVVPTPEPTPEIVEDIPEPAVLQTPVATPLVEAPSIPVEVAPTPAPQIAAIEPIEPYSLGLLSPRSIVFQDPSETGVTIDLAWANGEKTRSYIIQTSASADFSEIIAEQKTNEARFPISNLNNSVYWRVKEDAPGSNWSETGEIKVPSVPLLKTKQLASSPGENITILRATSNVAGKRTFRVLDESNAIVFEKETPGKIVEIPNLSPGTYTWYVTQTSDIQYAASRVDRFQIRQRIVTKERERPTESFFKLDFIPYGSMFGYKSNRNTTQDYNSTDFSAGVDLRAGYERSGFEAYLHYEYDYAEYFLVEENQDSEEVINQAGGLGAGYIFKWPSWQLATRLAFLTQDFVSVIESNDILTTEPSTMDLLTTEIGPRLILSDWSFELLLMQSIAQLNEDDYTKGGERTDIKIHALQKSTAISGDILYGLAYRRLQAQFPQENGYVEMNGLAGFLGLKFAF